jgi:hypothetical protein
MCVCVCVCVSIYISHFNYQQLCSLMIRSTSQPLSHHKCLVTMNFNLPINVYHNDIYKHQNAWVIKKYKYYTETYFVLRI